MALPIGSPGQGSVRIRTRDPHKGYWESGGLPTRPRRAGAIPRAATARLEIPSRLFPGVGATKELTTLGFAFSYHFRVLVSAPRPLLHDGLSPTTAGGLVPALFRKVEWLGVGAARNNSSCCR